MSRVVAVCISWKHETWSIPDVPFHCHVSDERPFPRVKSKERVAHLANLRNRAVSEALSSYPEAQHILMIDSYYLAQTEQVKRLLLEYGNTLPSEERIVGASTWFQDRTRIRAQVRFWDNWITPEAANLKLPTSENPGWIRVRAVGACYVYPSRIWKEHHYNVPGEGGEHVYLCVKSGLPVWLSLNVRLWRDPVVYTRRKRLRHSLHLGRFRGKSDANEARTQANAPADVGSSWEIGPALLVHPLSRGPMMM
jgi:hypothetical protein